MSVIDKAATLNLMKDYLSILGLVYLVDSVLLDKLNAFHDARKVLLHFGGGSCTLVQWLVLSEGAIQFKSQIKARSSRVHGHAPG